MNTRAFKPVLVIGLIVAGCVFALRAQAANGPKTERNTEQDEILRKYDKNMNGRLDPDERAALEADRRRAKEERERKQRTETAKKQGK